MDERNPLLSASAAPTAPPLLPPAYDSIGQGSATEFDTATGHVSFELPPPYIPSSLTGLPMINCKVCQAAISLDGKNSQLVVKCGSCNEATPIRSAPPGKKYVRCQCNCLLICKAESRRVVCPRETCRKVIVLSEPQIPDTHIPGFVRVNCGHCSGVFSFNIVTPALAICPHCRRVSSVGPSFARKRALLWFIPTCCLLMVAILVTLLTHHSAASNHGLIAAYVFLFLFAVISLWRALRYTCMKVSHIEGPA